MPKDFQIFNLKNFVADYMGDAPDFLSSTDHIQVYPLSLGVRFIQIPTQLFKMRYSFLLLFAEGGGTQQINNEIIELTANDALFIKEGHLTAINFINPQSKGYFIYLDNFILPQVLPDRVLLNRFSFFPKFSVTTPEMQWLGQCCELLLQQTTNEAYAAEIKVALLKSILLKLAKANAGELLMPDRSSEITMLFKELLYENFAQQRIVAFYADALSVTKNYLNRCVSQATQKPPKQHINEMVIYHSKILLQDQTKSISEVAFELNFSDPSYFGRLFKQVTQTTPTAYRLSLLHDLSE